MRNPCLASFVSHSDEKADQESNSQNAGRQQADRRGIRNCVRPKHCGLSLHWMVQGVIFV
jgi:hypothetical protein